MITHSTINFDYNKQYRRRTRSITLITITMASYLVIGASRGLGVRSSPSKYLGVLTVAVRVHSSAFSEQSKYSHRYCPQQNGNGWKASKGWNWRCNDLSSWYSRCSGSPKGCWWSCTTLGIERAGSSHCKRGNDARYICPSQFERYVGRDIMCTKSADIRWREHQPDVLNKDMFDAFNTNVIGVMNVVSAFLPLVKQSQLKKVILISTAMGDLSMSSDRYPWLGWPFCRISQRQWYLCWCTICCEQSSSQYCQLEVSSGLCFRRFTFCRD